MSFFTLIFGVILNPALNQGGYNISLTTNYTLYISKDIQLESFVHQDLTQTLPSYS